MLSQMLGLDKITRWSPHPSSGLVFSGMLALLLLLPTVWGGSLQEEEELSLDIPEKVTAQENLCIRVPCRVSYSRKENSTSQIFFSWERVGQKQSQLVATNDPQKKILQKFQYRFSLISNHQYECSLSILNAQKSDQGKYTLLVNKGKIRNESKNEVFITVSDLEQKPIIQVPETLESGSPKTLTCKMPDTCQGKNSHTFLWTGSALSSQNPGNRTWNSSELSLTPRPQDHGTNLTCRVIFERSCVSSESTVQLTVTYPPQKLTVQVFLGNWRVLESPGNMFFLPVLEGESLNLSCAADSNPAVSLKWVKGGQILTSSQPSAAGIVNLQLHQVGPRDSGKYRCQTQNSLRSQEASLKLSVQYPPKLLSSSCSWAEDGLLCTCSVQAEPAPSLSWWLGESPVEGNSTLQVVSTTSGVWTNSSLRLKEKLDSTLSLRCEGKNRHGTHSLSILLEPDRPTPELSMKTLIVGATCGAAVTGLLALGLLIIVVKIFKKKLAEVKTKASGAKANGVNMHATTETIPLDPAGHTLSSQNPNEMRRQTSSLDLQAGDTTCPTFDEGSELHYACLKFLGLRPREFQESSSANTEYAEIKLPNQTL